MSYEAVQSLPLFTFRDEKETAAKWVSRGMGNKGEPACLFSGCADLSLIVWSIAGTWARVFRRWGHYRVRIPLVERETLSVTIVWLRQRHNPLAIPDPSIISLTQIPSQFRFICAASLTRSIGGSGEGEGQKLGL